MKHSEQEVGQDGAAEGDPQISSGEESGSDEAKEAGGSDRLVRLSEAVRYRKRAQAAERDLGDIKGQYQDTCVELEQARQVIDQLERRQQIDAVLAEVDAVDLDVARLLTEAAVEMMDEPDIKLAIDDLRRHKPYLFRNRDRGASAMSARYPENSVYQAEAAADRAAMTGDRRDLLRYLRIRRKG